MSTRSGAHYHSSPSHPEPTMDNETGNMFRTITDQLAQITTSLNQFGGRVHTLELESPRPRHHHHDSALYSDCGTPLPIPPHEPRRHLLYESDYYSRRSYQYEPEPNSRRSYQYESEYSPRGPYRHNPEYNPRRPNLDRVNHDDQIFRSAPVLHDPEKYLDWEREMNQYLE